MTTFLYGYVSELTMSDVYSPPDRVVVESHCKGMDEYKKMYDESIKQPHK